MTKRNCSMLIGINLDNIKNTFFTSDQHFGHENIIKACKRPFETVGEMNQALIAAWNKVVPENGMVFHLGDFTLGDNAEEFFRQLNGNIQILSLPWHHDKRWLNKRIYYSKSGNQVKLLPPMVVLEVKKYNDSGWPLVITLCHYPMRSWDRSHYGALHLHGHIHTICDSKSVINTKNSLDVGVDNSCNFAPFPFDYIVDLVYN